MNFESATLKDYCYLKYRISYGKGKIWHNHARLSQKMVFFVFEIKKYQSW